MATSPELFFFDRNHLVQLARGLHDDYLKADPFPSVVIDDFLPAEVARSILAQFPSPDFDGFKQPDNAFQERKLGRTQESYFQGMSPGLRHFLGEFNSLAFIDFLEELTGIQGLIPDPHFKGGAVHQLLSGGRLAIHADFNRDSYRSLDRRVNALFYLNEDWKEEYGAYLELWDRKMTHCVKKIAPIINRCVIFNTGKDTFHGHPDPMHCPPQMTRKSIALYYYTNGRDDDDLEEHSTRWRARPGVAEVSGEGDRVHVPGARLLKKLRPFVPPVVFDWTRRKLL